MRAPAAVALCAWLLAAGGPRLPADEPPAEEPPAPGAAQIEFFEKRVRPLLADRCHKCHGPQEQKGGLRLDSRAAVLAGGESGPAVVPGKPDEGFLVGAVSYGEVYQMPPDGKLPDEEVAMLRRWVEMGAPWPDEPGAAQSPGSPDAFELAERARHWSFQPVAAHAPPEVRDAAWPLSPIDRFILARLEAAGLPPAAPADKRTLVRRVSYDLVGLPPTPEEVAAFLADDSPGAFAKVVDRLLGSPHFGERWARHWLDLVRYAETRGHEFDYAVPNAYQYRDYVIRAWNADVPYDQFVSEHIAGDLVANPRLHPAEGFNESILGTGFWFLGEEVHSPVDIRADEVERIDNKIDVMSKTFLGLTVACARCHDHKFDAISTRDYYALAGYVLSSGYRQVGFDSLEHNRRIAAALRVLRDEHRPRIMRAIAEAARPNLERTAEFLLAAREVLRPGSPAEPAASEPAAIERRIEDTAARADLDAVVVGHWVRQLRFALADPRDPLHPWALIAEDGGQEGQDGPRRLAELLAPLVDRWRQEEARAAEALQGARVIVDYARAGPEEWFEDGLAFGHGPVRPGDVTFGTDPEHPITQVHLYGAAQRDPPWDEVELAPGTERDPGRVNWLEAGRTLRTGTFALEAGRLWYLVKGSGYAYAAVDSHRLINGPLHAALVREWKGGDQLQWIEHDLTAYPGHRVHIEFSPRERGDVKPGESPDLAILLVVEGHERPGDIERPNRLLCDAVAGGAQRSPEALAATYERLLLDAAERFGAGAVAGCEDAADCAELANWLVQRPELFLGGDGPRRRVAEAAQEFIEEQGRLLASIQRASRTAPALWDGSGVDEAILVRGNHQTPGEVARRRFLEAIAGPDQPAIRRGSGRLELAARLTDPANPFAARVMVNRVWQHLFGRGIVASVDNFGVQGELPTHPELLDWLADQFVRQGWSTKKLIRSLALSRVYQMASRAGGPGDEFDPEDLLLHRMRVRRLEGEIIRDAVLAVSGRLDRTLFGPSVPVHLTPFMEGRGKPDSGPLDGAGRRSIYLAVRRNFLVPMFLAFDYPQPFTTIGRRGVSNVPAQALALLNDPFVVEQARHWADRALADNRKTAAERVGELYLAAFTRPPTPDELDGALLFLAEQAGRYGSDSSDPRAWADLGHVLLNVKEFVFIP